MQACYEWEFAGQLPWNFLKQHLLRNQKDMRNGRIVHLSDAWVCYAVGVYTKIKDVIEIGITSASLPAKKRILTVCVKLFLEKGYKRTTLAEIIEKADASYSTFQNIFRAKDGVLTELVEFMFSNQFAMACSMTGTQLPPVHVYAVETAIQMTLTELNENLREIYIEAYTQKEASEYIFRETARELYDIFGPYQPQLTAEDFYMLELGSAGLMRGYMAQPCGGALTLEKKLECFLTLSLRGYGVPEQEIQQALAFLRTMDLRAVGQRTIERLFHALEMRYDFQLGAASCGEREENT